MLFFNLQNVPEDLNNFSDNSFDAVIETSTFCSVLGKY